MHIEMYTSVPCLQHKLNLCLIFILSQNIIHISGAYLFVFVCVFDSFWPVLHNWYNIGHGICYFLVYGMVHIIIKDHCC